MATIQINGKTYRAAQCALHWVKFFPPEGIEQHKALWHQGETLKEMCMGCFLMKLSATFVASNGKRKVCAECDEKRDSLSPDAL